MQLTITACTAVFLALQGVDAATHKVKLHKLARADLDFSANSIEQLSQKYFGRPTSGNQQPFQLGKALASRKGRYPPSRDGEFTAMIEKDEFEQQLAKGGHGVPLTSEPFLPCALVRGVRAGAAAFGSTKVHRHLGCEKQDC